MVQGSEHQGNYMQWTASKMVSALQMPQYLKMKSRVDLKLYKDASREEIKMNLQLKEAESLVEKERIDKLSNYQKNLMLEHSTNETSKKKLIEWIQQHEALEYKQDESASSNNQSNGQLNDQAPSSNENSDKTNSLLTYLKKDTSNTINREIKEESDDESIIDSKGRNIVNLQERSELLLSIKDEEISENDENGYDDEDESLISSEEDETQEILKELQKLREEKQRESQIEQEINQAVELQNALQGNPLLSKPTNASLKRKWTDDTIFKNQAQIESKKKPRFVNDTLRNESHKKFMYSMMQ